MKNATKLILLSSMFLVIISFRGYAGPSWSDNQANVSSLTSYSPTAEVEFNITWNNATTAYIELLNDTEPYNCTATNIYDNVWSCTEILGANSGNQQYWKSYAVNSSSPDDWGTSNIWNFTINQAPSNVTLYLNGTLGNRSYNLNTVAYFTAQLNVSNKNISLNSSCPSWNNLTTTDSSSNASNIATLSCSGLFFLTAYWNGDENYSSASTTYYFDTIAPQYSITAPSSNLTYALNQTYWFNISTSSATIDKVVFEYNNTANQTSNGSFGSYWYPMVDIPASNFTYRWFINNSLGNTTVTPLFNYSILKKFPVIVLVQSSNIVNCTRVDTDQLQTISLYRNSTLVSYSSNSFANENTNLIAAGTYNYSCNASESQNYTHGDSNNLPVTVSSSSSGFVSNTLGSSPSSSGSFTVTPSTSNVTMESNSTTIVFTLANTFPSDITSVNISASGIDPSWYTLDKMSITRLQHDVGTNTVTMSINIPVNATAGTYTILLTATGRDFNLNPITTKQASVTMTIPQIPGSTANESLNSTASVAGTGSIFTGFSIKFQNFMDYIPLIILAVIVIAIIIFRDEVMDFVSGGKVKSPESKPETKPETKQSEAKKTSKFASIRGKVNSLRQRRLVIQFKKIKPEKEKKT